MSHQYRRDGTPYPDGDEGLLAWARDSAKGTAVRQEKLPNGYWVSTVWLGLDHNFSGIGPPLIFETMVQNPAGAWEDDFQQRYSTEDDAIVGHLETVDLYKGKACVTDTQSPRPPED